MMTVIQKYVLRNFLSGLLICLTVIIGLTIMMDFVQRLDEFSELIEASNYSWWFAMEYYLLRIPLFLSFLMPVILLIAAGITLIRMNRHHELVPFFMSGVSVYQILIPVFITCGLGVVVVFGLQEWILPKYSLRYAVTETLLDQGSDSKSQVMTGDKSGTYAQFSKIHLSDQSAEGITVLHFDGNQLVSLTDAQRAIWIEEEEKWKFQDGRITEYNPDGLRKGAPRIFGKENGPYWKTPGKSSLNPRKLLVQNSDINFFTSLDLYRLTRKLPHLPTVAVRFHNRISYPFVAFFLPLFGIPVLMRRETRSYFIGALICAGVAIGFYLVQVMFLELGNRGQVHPVIACWLPLILLISLSLTLYDQIMT